MKIQFAAIALTIASGLIVATPSFAAVTREQVNAELAAAVRSGDIVADGETGLKLNELYPNRYPARPVQAGLTREQVKAELANALRTGDYELNGEIGGKCNEIHPNMHKST